MAEGYPMVIPGADGMFGGSGNGMIGGLILGSLLRNNGNLFGGNGADAAALRSPPEQSQANMSIMSGLGDIKQAVALGTATTETSNAVQTGTLSGAIQNSTAANMSAVNSLKDVVNGNTVALMNQINAVDKSVMENRYELGKDINNDGDKTRALLVAQYEATLNRQLQEANAAIIELRGQHRLSDATRGIEVTTTNNINQAQAQQQQQQQFNNLAGLVANLANDLQYIRATNQAINIGGTQTANPSNANTNVRA